LLHSIAIFEVVPNTAILIIVSYAILRGDIEGAFTGFFAGLLQDIFFGRYIGLNAFLYMTAGFICGKPFRDFYRESFLTPLFLSGVATLCYEIAFYFTNYFFRARLDFLYYLNRNILPGTVYTLIMSIPLYRIVYAINAKLEAYEKARRRLF